MNDLIRWGLDATASALDLVPITPDDDADLSEIARAIRCKPTGGAGDVRFMSYNGEIRTTSIAQGEMLAVMAVRVYETGTTATGLEAIV